MNSLQDRLNVLWCHREWRCEYLPSTASAEPGSVRLFMGSTAVVEHQAPTLNEMLRIASFWREVVVGPELATAPGEVLLVPKPDRRVSTDRRAFDRGGRRRADAGRSVRTRVGQIT